MDDAQNLLAKRNAIRYELYKRDPLRWLKECARTFDEHDAVNPIKPFPIKPYIEPLVREWTSETILHIAKSRQMSISWLSVAMLLWEGQFFAYRLQMAFSKKEEDAHALVERAKFIYENQPLWLRNMCPLDRKLRDMPYGELYFANGSKFIGKAQGKDQVRGYVPSTVFLDEMAFQDKAEETYGAVVPCAQKIISVSSAGPGFFQRLVEL